MQQKKLSHFLLIGSYNGQDSLGDKGIVRAVALQLKVSDSEEHNSLCHVVNIEKGVDTKHVSFSYGAENCVSSCWHIMRMCKKYPYIRLFVSYLILPLWWLHSKKNRSLWSKFISDCKNAKLLYFFGGTQLSSQWFLLNMPSILLTILVMRFYGKPIYFGPQQYGPLEASQRLLLLNIINWFVTDIRTRSEICLKNLNLRENQLAWDEIFSCDKILPIEEPAEKKDYLLINFRETDFLEEKLGEGKLCIEAKKFALMVKILSEYWKCPVKVLQMSGPCFSDDRRIADFLREIGVSVEILPHTHDESSIYKWSRDARACIAMSFHACILCLMTGKPGIPVPIGNYYDYKFADFDRYFGMQKVPIVNLNELSPQEWADKIIHYEVRHSPKLVIETRKKAKILLDEWYSSIQN